jgi:glucose/arabinose dehydrogenase
MTKGVDVIHPARRVRHTACVGITVLAAAAALLTAGASQPASADAMSSSTVADQDADGGIPVGVTSFSRNWTNPWGVAFLPAGRSALVTERHSYGVYRLGRDGSKKWIGTVPYTLAGQQQPQMGTGGLLGVAPSPTWNGTTDKQVFFVHTASTETRVVRMDYDGTSLSNYTVVLGGIKRGGDHNGGKLAFGPDGYLYVAIGDALQPRLAADKSSLNGKILRITRTGAPAPGNPFGTRVHSYGHRNPQGLAWDRKGRLWSVEIGESTDELNLIKPGANYGYPACYGSCRVPGMTNPKLVWPSAKAVPAQIAIVRNVIYVSSLRGQRLWRIPIDGDSEGVGAKTDFYANQYGRLRALAKVPGTNELWLGTSDRGRGIDQMLRVTIK